MDTQVQFCLGSPWSCDSCHKTVGVSMVKDKINDVLDIIAKNRNEDNPRMLTVISDLEEVLHPNHYLILGLKEIVIQRLMKRIAKSKRKASLGNRSECDILLFH